MTNKEKMTIQRAQKGDALALARLHDRYYRDIFRYFYYRVGDDDYAQTLTSNLFIRIVDRIGIYKPEKIPFLSWLYSLARSEMLEDLLERGKNYHHGMIFESAEEVPSNSPGALKHALAMLSVDERDVIVGRIIEKRSVKEVAREIGHSVAGVRSLQNQALQKLIILSNQDGAP
jgi:RNA polymerase sigma-70 factor (ECF subfamily)